MSDDAQIIYPSADSTVETITLITTGPQGPPGEAGADGAPGPPGESIEVGAIIACTTEMPLSGHRFVVLDNDMAVYADCLTENHAHRVIGMTTGASDDGNVSVQTSGEHEEPTWSWTLGHPVFLGENGLMTQTAPTTGFSLIVGFPMTATKLFIKINQPIICV